MRRRTSIRSRIQAAALGLVVLSALMVPMSASAIGAGVLSGPVDTPPGGATVTMNSCPKTFNPPCEGTAGGRTFTYSAMATSQFTDLYWTPTTSLPQLSLNGTSANVHNAVNLPFSGIDGGNPKIARWLCQPASCSIPIFTYSGGGSGTTNLRGRFTATVTSGNNWILATSKGLSSSVGVITPVTGNFSVNVIFEVSPDGVTWTPAVDYYNVASTDQARHTYTSFARGFFYNRPPVALNSSVSTDEDTSVAVPLNVNDPDGNTLNYTIGTPAHGTLSGTAPNLTYTPAANYNGPDSFSYSVNDGFAVTASATVSINVFPINDAPVADNLSVSTDEDTPVTFTVTGSDIDTAAENLAFSLVSPTTNGQLDTSSMPTITYTPDADYNGPDTLTFDVYDGALHASPLGQVSITVNPVNDAPIAIDSAVETQEDTPIAITMQANDIDTAAENLTFTILTGPEHGSFSPAPDGSAIVNYVPDSNYNGPDSFTFKVGDGSLESGEATVSITVTDINDAPVADAQSLSTDEDTPLALTLTASDVDNDLSELSFEVVTPPAHGQLTGEGAALIYTPDPDYFGPDSFTFKANDGALDSNEATISIDVAAINDAPVADDDISVETLEDNSIEVTLTGYDVDNLDEELTYSIVDGPAHGQLVGDGTTYTYVPDADYFGPDSFTFKINDGSLDSNVATVAVNVVAVNDAPIASDAAVMTDEDTPLAIVLGGSDVDNLPAELQFTIVDGPVQGSVEIEGANVVYTPFLNYNGPDSFTFKISDGDLESNIATVSIVVNAVNDNPVAGADTVTTPQYTPVTFAVLGNDSDVDFDELTVVSATNGAHGSATVNEDGTITYSPTPTFKGADSLTYTISDGNGGTAVGEVTITEEGCGEDGAASGAVDHEVEPVVGSVDAETAATLHAYNCAYVVSVEGMIDEVTP